ncbi:MAG: hypothetical protein L0027_03710 [Candidatus Rokubacteria bacterium]|nr:hypothetical protein [Candidatus Rokubacteria bacterium]
MNELDRLLRQDLNYLLDRLAAMTPEGIASRAAEERPELGWRLAEAEARLSAIRSVLLREYAEWGLALEECEELWALAGRPDQEEAQVGLQAA